MNVSKRIMSLLLIIVLLLTSTMFTTHSAEEKNIFESTITNIGADDILNTSTEVTPVIDVLSGRVQSQETNLNTHIIQNGDGTFTKSVYDGYRETIQRIF